MTIPREPIGCSIDPVWADFLEELTSGVEQWTSEIVPPLTFDGMSTVEIAAEIDVVLRYLLRDPDRRRTWLLELLAAGYLPLRFESDDLAISCIARLRSSGCTAEEMVLLGGRTGESHLQSFSRSELPATGWQTNHVHEDDSDWDSLPPAAAVYTMQIRNATTTTFDELVVFYQRRNELGVVFLGESPFPPNAQHIFPLGPCGELVSYTVGVFLTGSMVARIPDQGGAMTPRLAASLDANRPDNCTDAWAIYQADLLPLANLTYSVIIRNRTPDDWDEVVLFYTLRGQTGSSATTRTVLSMGSVTIPLGPCDEVIGYFFSIYVDGQLVDFDAREDVERTIFPLVGQMNALRSLKEHVIPDWQPCEDIWTVGVL